MEEAGLLAMLALLDFLVMSTTPPFSPAWMPMAYIHCHKHISNTSISNTSSLKSDMGSVVYLVVHKTLMLRPN